MPRPDGDPLFVQDGRQIVRVDLVVPEADRSSWDVGVFRTIDHGPGIEQTAWAASTSCFKGVMVPSAFDMAVTPRILVRSPSSSPRLERSRRPSSVKPR